MLIVMVPILVNKDELEPSYNDLKFIETDWEGRSWPWLDTASHPLRTGFPVPGLQRVSWVILDNSGGPPKAGRGRAWRGK